MINRYTHGSVTWIDVINPSNDTIRELMEECSIPPEFTTDLTSMTPRTETHAKKNVLKITLDYPIVKRTDIDHAHEIKIIATKYHLITIRFEDMEAMHHFGKNFEVMCHSVAKHQAITTDFLFFALLTHLYESLDHKLDYLENQLSDTEKAIFNNQEREMVFAISTLSRRLIDFRQVMGAHEWALEDLAEGAHIAFNKNYAEQVDTITNRYNHIRRRQRALLATAESLRDTNVALVTTTQNDVMKMFTILAFITFPLTLFTSMFGMNTISTPLVGNPGDFWIILGIMIIVSVSFFAYFKYRKWF